jgi:hypothetical protein
MFVHYSISFVLKHFREKKSRLPGFPGEAASNGFGQPDLGYV